MDRNPKFQTIIEKAYMCKTIYEQLEQDAGFSGSPRIETALRMGMSIAQADRYRYFAYLLPELQNLVRDKKLELVISQLFFHTPKLSSEKSIQSYQMH